MAFRKDFVWGAATASYQVEGAYNEDNRGWTIWDEFCTQNDKISDRSNGNIACDHYHKMKDDVKLMSELGLKAYRFSIAWARILPKGTGEVNQKGIQFYKDLIDELLKYNITPYATLYHWDLPYELHLKGGWLNPEISEWFAEYTEVIAKNFGDKLKHFITFNESEVFAGCGYQSGAHAPGYKLTDKELLHICHHVLVSHGKAVQVLRKNVPDAVIGFTTATTPQCPVADKDIDAAKNAYFSCGRGNFIYAQSFWLDPIVFGRYPEQIQKDYGNDFPAYTAEEMKIISTPIDFLGINTYTGFPVEVDGNGNLVSAKRVFGHPRTAFNWDIIPPALYWGPRFLYEKYALPIIITENGMSCHDVISLDGKVHDPNRIDYLHRYIAALKKANDDGADIRGYFQWSFMDNFEWARGYEERFGMIYVDYGDQRRVPKDSAYWYKDTISSNGENL